MWKNWIVQVWLNDNWWMRFWCSWSVHSREEWVSKEEIEWVCPTSNSTLVFLGVSPENSGGTLDMT